MTANQMVKEITTQIAQNITLDTVKFGSAESAAKFQFSQMVQAGIPAEVANGIIQLALEALTNA
jgi:hypothetical protein